MAVFQTIFLSSFQSCGRSGASICPSLLGPRNWFQFVCANAEFESRKKMPWISIRQVDLEYIMMERSVILKQTDYLAWGRNGKSSFNCWVVGREPYSQISNASANFTLFPTSIPYRRMSGSRNLLASFPCRRSQRWYSHSWWLCAKWTRASNKTNG